MGNDVSVLKSGLNTPALVRVLVIADVRLYRDGLVQALSAYPALDVIGGASNAPEALSAVLTRTPAVAVVDMATPEAFELLRALRAHAPGTRTVAFAIDEDVATIIDCAEAGAAGYVTVEGSLDDLAQAICRAAAGELLCTPRIAAELFRRVGAAAERRIDSEAPASLTGREREVLDLLRPGLSNKAIASALNISQATVKNHVHHVLDKLKVGSRQQAAARATEAASRKRRASSR